MRDPVTTHEKDHGFTIEIHYDTDPINPREDYDQLGVLVVPRGNRYLSGDEKGLEKFMAAVSKLPDAEDDMDLKKALELADKSDDIVTLPVYMYAHSGVTINTTGFSCPWDSGQAGFIFTTQERMKELVGADEKEFKRRAAEMLKGEVETFDKFITGEIYGFITKDPDGEEVDSCWGFYGEDDAKQAAEENIEHYIEAWMSFIPGELF